MKTGKQLAKVKQLLKNENYQVEMVENCGMKNEKIYRTIDDIPETTGYYSLMIIKRSRKNKGGKYVITFVGACPGAEDLITD